MSSPKLKPVITEKAVMMIETRNVLTFQTEKEARKEDIKSEVEGLFNVKVEKIGTMIKGNKKYAHVQLKKSHAAIDVATKLGVM